MKILLKYLFQSLSIPRNMWWIMEFTLQIDNIGGFPGRKKYVNFQNFKCCIHPFCKIESQWSNNYSGKKIDS